MKKKILASLLAVAMMASLVVPAFADTYQPSSQSGTDDQITALKFDKDSINVPNGKTDGVKLMEHLTAYVGNDKIVQDPTTLEWSINDNLALGLNDDGSVYAVEDSGNAVVTVKVPGKDISASIKVIATKQVEKKPAQGYKFEKTNYTATTTSNAGQLDSNNDAWGNVEFSIVPLSDQYAFQDDQISYIKTEVLRITSGSATLASNFNQEPATLKFSKDDAVEGTYTGFVGSADKITFTFTPTATDREKMQTLGANKTAIFTIPQMQLPKGDGVADHYTPVPSRTARVEIKKPIQAQKIIRTASVKIEVGQTADLRDCYAITTGANYDDGVNVMMDYYNDSSTAADYAVQSTDSEHDYLIRGIAVGKQKATVSLNNGQATTTIPIEVVPRGTLKNEDTSTMSLSATTGALKVGETMTINAKGVAEGKEVTWTPSNNNITVTMKTTGEGPATITGKTAGTTLLFARVDGEIIGSAQITVANADGTVPAPAPAPAPTPNPSTGDSIFSNLF